MNGKASIPFAGQKMIYMALVVGIAMYAIVAGLILKSNDGVGIMEEPIQMLDTASSLVGIALALAAIAARIIFNKRASAAELSGRSMQRLLSLLVPIFLLEAACCFAITVWLFNGKAIPSLAVACILLSIAIAMMPLQDPDAESI